MNTFEYDRTISSEEKKNQSELAGFEKYLDRKLGSKMLDFIDKI